MKKKTLVILLIIPFVISLLTFVSVSIMTNLVAADISDIAWTYASNQGFKISDEPYKLMATPIYDTSLVLAPGNDLVWFAKDEDGSDTDIVSIEKKNQDYYLYALNEGVCDIICQNERGTVSKQFKAHIYKNGAIIINPLRQGSASNIDSETYYGRYDLSYDSLGMDKAVGVNAKFEVVPTLLEGDSKIFAVSETNNASIENNIITIKGSGEARIRFYTTSEPIVTSYYTFNIIEEGYNVYNYNDLLMCTNYSSEGKKVVLQTHLESLQNVYRLDSDGNYQNKKQLGKENYELFGNFDFKKQTFNFDKEILEIESTYNTRFIEQYKESGSPNPIDPIIKVGLNVQKDIYGNGYTINAHGLCYPNNGKIASNGKLTPQSGDYFFGPLPLVTIGAIKDNSVVKAYGQDNALIYLNGDNILINDLKVRNTNEIDNMYNLLYTGSVIDVHGHNNTIKNSIISNGRNVVRAFSSDGLTISNSILKNGAQFLLEIGSDKYNTYDTSKDVEATYNGVDYSNNFNEFYDIENEKGASFILEDILTKDFTSEKEINEAMNILNQIQAGLDNTAGLYDYNDNVMYKDEINLNKVYFSNSGIFSIAFNTLFNGPFLYNGMPKTVIDALDMFSSIPPDMIGGTSYPAKLNIDDKTKFYDWKDIDSIDTSVLIEENISSFIQQIFGKDIQLSMEDYFPMKTVLKEKILNNHYHYNNDNKSYINSKVAWYGGGLNLSAVEFENEEDMDLGDMLEVNLLRNVLEGKHMSSIFYIELLAKCVNIAAGFHPFKFLTNGEVTSVPEEFNKVPQIQDLK